MSRSVIQNLTNGVNKSLLMPETNKYEFYHKNIPDSYKFYETNKKLNTQYKNRKKKIPKTLQ
jgi:hypothetical protein